MELKKPGTLRVWLRMYQCYREAFPASERKPFWIIVKMYRQKKSDIWYWTQKGNFAGFATTINGDGLILLDYFATVRKYRGEGLGTQALLELQNLYGDQGLFVEIERVYPEASNGPQREKRKQFYLNCGMETLGVEALVFGVEMELLGSRCTMSFDRYYGFYRDHYGPWAAEHIQRIRE